MAHTRTLVLIASEGGARLCESAGIGKGLNLVEEVDPAAFSDTDPRYSDQRGRGQAAPGIGRHAFEPKTSERRQRREAFTLHLVEVLRDAWDRGGHERIVISAPPKLLGAIRAHLSPALCEAVAVEVPKDLAKVALGDVPSHFSDRILL